jgi:predicted nucleic acid-binding protein
MRSDRVAEHLVLDVSAAIAIARGEPGAVGVRTILADHLGGGGGIDVPSHFWLEFVNVLVRRYGRTPAEVIEAVRELDALGIETFEIDRSLLMLALHGMLSASLSAYDAAYLALAEVVDGRLLTLDDRLSAAAGERAFPRPADGPRRPAPTPATYVPAAAAALSAAPIFVAYLAELRHRAEATG